MQCQSQKLTRTPGVAPTLFWKSICYWKRINSIFTSIMCFLISSYHIRKNTLMYSVASYLFLLQKYEFVSRKRSLSMGNYPSRCYTLKNIDLSIGWLWKRHRKWFILRLKLLQTRGVKLESLFTKFFNSKSNITRSFRQLMALMFANIKKVATFCKEVFISICMES